MTRARINYTNRDYESMRRELLARVPQLTDRWTDFNTSDLGVVLLELFCGAGDMLAYYLDAQAGEAFLPTVRQRGNLINLCKLISYRLKGPVSATTELRFTLQTPLDQDAVLPRGVRCRAIIDRDEIDFVTVAALTIPAGETVGTIAARQGTPQSEDFVASGVAGKRLELRGKRIALGSLRIWIDGEEWKEVAHFQESSGSAHHFLADTDGLDQTTILFGNGRRGQLPPSGSTIRVEYLETLGANGNLAPGLIRTVVSTINLGDIPLRLSVTNPIAATGGQETESLDHARSQAPAELRSLWKAVTREDYQALAEGFPGVGKARVLDVNDCTNIRYYQVNLVVAPAGGGMPTPQLLADLGAFLDQRRVITVEVRLYEPVYLPIDILADIYAFSGENTETVESRITSAVEEFFSFERMDFGRAVYFSDLVALLDGVPGVSHVHLHKPHKDTLIPMGAIAVLGNLQFTVRTVT